MQKLLKQIIKISVLIFGYIIGGVPPKPSSRGRKSKESSGAPASAQPSKQQEC